MHVFDFLGNSILKEVLSAIQKGKPGAFSPGKPKEFLRNYKASLGFLDFLEGILMLQLDYFSANNVEPELDSTVFFFHPRVSQKLHSPIYIHISKVHMGI